MIESVKCVIAGQKPGAGSSSSLLRAVLRDVRGCTILVALRDGFVRVWRTGCLLFELTDGSESVVPEKALIVSCAIAQQQDGAVWRKRIKLHCVQAISSDFSWERNGEVRSLVVGLG